MKKIITLSAVAFLSTVTFAAEVAAEEAAAPTAQEIATQKMQTQLDALNAKIESFESAQADATQKNSAEAVDKNAAMQTTIDELNTKIAKLEKKQGKNTKNISKVNALANKDNIKFDVDFRTSYDNIQYESINGTKYNNDALYSMRLWLGMGYAPKGTDMIFKGQLSMNKAFGASYMQRATGHGFDTFDWVRNEQLTDDSVHVREAYWLWTPKVGDVGLTMSVGRRPATNGYLVNLRDDDKAQSPLGHVINMEFDGASMGFKLDEYSPGLAFKICAGRGLTNATSWASQATMAIAGEQAAQVGGTIYPSYAESPDHLDNTDMLGFIFTPYDDGQYAVKATWYRGFSVPGLYATEMDGATGQLAPTTYEMKSGGNMDGGAVSFKVEGIGDEINDFLDETIIFASFAYSQSHPENITRSITNHPAGAPDGDYTSASMLGSDESETGTSYWLGVQMPNLTGGQFGLEYNHGSEHWKAFTYGEDTLAGSKMAVRGNAYEAYWTQPIIDKVFSMQVRYTYLDYDYTGSGGFFGDGSTSMEINSDGSKATDSIDTAQDIRVYFRYRY